MPTKATSQPIFIVKKVTRSVSIGLIEQTSTSKKPMLSTYHLVIEEKLRKLSLNILNISNKNGMHLKGNVNNEKISPSESYSL